MLRESAALQGTDLNLDGLTDPERAGALDVPGAELLSRFSDAIVDQDDAATAAAREDMIATMGPEYMVDAVGVASNFQRMVRIADGTGIPLDDTWAAISADLREDLGINDYVTAANTPETGLLKALLQKFVAVPMFRKIAQRTSTQS